MYWAFLLQAEPIGNSGDSINLNGGFMIWIFVESCEFDNYFHNHVDYIVDGKVGDSKKPSRILDLITKEVLRAGD